MQGGPRISQTWKCSARNSGMLLNTDLVGCPTFCKCHNRVAFGTGLPLFLSCSCSRLRFLFVQYLTNELLNVCRIFEIYKKKNQTRWQWRHFCSTCLKQPCRGCFLLFTPKSNKLCNLVRGAQTFACNSTPHSSES